MPELCTFHPLTRSAHAIAKHVPRILWWLHSLLNAQELRNHLLPQPVGKRCAQPQADTVRQQYGLLRSRKSFASLGH